MSIDDGLVKTRNKRAFAPGSNPTMGPEPRKRRCLNCRLMSTAPSGDRHICTVTGKIAHPEDDACEKYQRWKARYLDK
ncbi:MAG: hypothetical protein M0R06_20255 [Sphaerochaeta sp.]|jgi:hypothetical protein|nr:hypothetical protein [Sphaerochaeta sp.]